MSYLGPVSSNQDGTIINYIPYGTIENNTTRGWSACTLTWSGTTPSGAPTLTATQMAISASSVSPLSSLYSLLLTKSAANAQYQGFVSDAFTIKREDLAKVLTGSFYYEVASGTVDMSGTSTQSLEIWVYNVNANQWIQPAGYRGLNQSSGPGLVSFTFQTDSTAANNSYRIAVITQQTSATAYTVKFDNFKLSPQTAPIGPVVTDWVDRGAITITGSTSNPTKGATAVDKMWTRRVGDNLEVRVEYVQSATGTAGSGDYLLSLPAGLSIDTSKLTPDSAVEGGGSDYTLNNSVGDANLGVSTTNLVGTVCVFDATRVRVFGIDTNGSGVNRGAWGSTYFSLSSANMFLTASFSVPISGWSSNVQLSNDTDTRVVDFKIVQSTNQSISNGVVTKVNFGSVIHDTHGSYSSANSWYVIPVSGYYDLKARVSFVYNATGIRYIVAEKNSAQFLAVSPILAATTSAGDYTTVVINEEFYFDAGDRVYINAVQNSGGALSVSNGNASTENRTALSITRRSGPSVIAASDSVSLRATSATTAVGTAVTTVVFSSKEYDTHNIYSTSTGAISIPVSGKYSIRVITESPSGASASTANAGTYLMIYKGNPGSGVINTLLSNLRWPLATGTGMPVILQGGTTVQANAGDVFYITQQRDASISAYSLSGTATTNVLVVERVGN